MVYLKEKYKVIPEFLQTLTLILDSDIDIIYMYALRRLTFSCPYFSLRVFMGQFNWKHTCEGRGDVSCSKGSD